MFRYLSALYCALFLITCLEPIVAKRNFGGGGSRHSYPKSGGLSGGGHSSSGGLSGSGGHGYPSSGGNHGYPSSGGMSGSHGYPSSGGSHSYPSGGNHGYPSSGGMSGGSHGYPSSGGSSYPSTGGNHGYPATGGKAGYPSGGMSGNSNNHGYPAGGGLSGNTNYGNQRHVNYNYNYKPPQQITYPSSVAGGRPVSYPVYHGSPPTYVYQYKDSGSKYGTLLAGLALLNLGTLGTTAYLASKQNGGGGSSTYKTQPGEICKFGVKKDNGDYEETKIDCQLISSFIWEEQAKANNASNNTSITTTTVTNVTVVNTTNGVQDAPASSPPVASNVLYNMLPNGTLVPVNATSMNTTANVMNNTEANNTMTSSVTTSVVNTTTTVTNALDVKGKPIDVTPGMQCFAIRVTPTSKMRRAFPCGLLQTYAEKSIQKKEKSAASRNVPLLTVLAVVVYTFV